MDRDTRIRIEALTHLKAAIMHIEASMALDAEYWTGEEVKMAREARDKVRELGASLDS